MQTTIDLEGIYSLSQLSSAVLPSSERSGSRGENFFSEAYLVQKPFL